MKIHTVRTVFVHILFWGKLQVTICIWSKTKTIFNFTMKDFIEKDIACTSLFYDVLYGKKPFRLQILPLHFMIAIFQWAQPLLKIWGLLQCFISDSRIMAKSYNACVVSSVSSLTCDVSQDSNTDLFGYEMICTRLLFTFCHLQWQYSALSVKW